MKRFSAVEHKQQLEHIVEALTGSQPYIIYISQNERTNYFSSELEQGKVPILIPATMIADDYTYKTHAEYLEFLVALQAGRLMYDSAVVDIEHFADTIEDMYKRKIFDDKKAIWNIDQFFSAFSARNQLAREIFHIVESSRINANLKRDFIGYKENMESAVPKQFKDHMDGLGFMNKQELDNMVLTLLQYQLMLGYLPKHKIRGKMGEHNRIRAAKKKGITIKPYIERVYEVFEECNSIAKKVLDRNSTIGDSILITALLHKIIYENSKERHSTGVTPNTLKGIMGFTEKEHMAIKSQDEIKEMEVFKKEAPKLVEEQKDADIYPEWNSEKERYIQEGCAVFDSSKGYGNKAQRIIVPNKNLEKKIKREFGLVKPAGRSILRKQRSGELDYERYVEYMNDVSAGIIPDDRIYKKVLNRKRDVAALVLVDLSGSTNRWISEELKIIDVIAEAVYYLSCGVSELDDLVGVFGYSSHGRRRTDFYTIADFGDANSKNPQFLRNLSQITGKKQNHDGVAIRHATKKLIDTGRKNKLLVHISDGEPEAVFLKSKLYGDEKGMPKYKDDYAWKDVGRALSEARAKGVLPICIRVNDQKKEGLERAYGTHYRLISNPLNLKDVLCSTYKGLIS